MADQDRERRSQSRTFKQLPRQVRNELLDRGLTAIFWKIARKHHVTVDEAFSHNRSQHLVDTRAEMYLYLADEAKWGLTPIAELFGRDIMSVRNALGRIRKANAKRDQERVSKQIAEDGAEGKGRRAG